MLFLIGFGILFSFNNFASAEDRDATKVINPAIAPPAFTAQQLRLLRRQELKVSSLERGCGQGAGTSVSNACRNYEIERGILGGFQSATPQNLNTISDSNSAFRRAVTAAALARQLSTTVERLREYCENTKCRKKTLKQLSSATNNLERQEAALKAALTKTPGQFVGIINKTRRGEDPSLPENPLQPFLPDSTCNSITLMQYTPIGTYEKQCVAVPPSCPADLATAGPELRHIAFHLPRKGPTFNSLEECEQRAIPSFACTAAVVDSHAYDFVTKSCEKVLATDGCGTSRSAKSDRFYNVVYPSKAACEASAEFKTQGRAAAGAATPANATIK